MEKNSLQLSFKDDPNFYKPTLKLSAKGLHPRTARVLIQALKDNYEHVSIKIVPHRYNVDISYDVGGLNG